MYYIIDMIDLGLPKDISKEKPLWFSEGLYKDFWKKFILPVTGGRIEFDEEKAKKIL